MKVGWARYRRHNKEDRSFDIHNKRVSVSTPCRLKGDLILSRIEEKLEKFKESFMFQTKELFSVLSKQLSIESANRNALETSEINFLEVIDSKNEYVEDDAMQRVLHVLKA